MTPKIRTATFTINNSKISKIRSAILFILLICGFTCSLVGCGQKGLLELPAPNTNDNNQANSHNTSSKQ